MKHLVFSLALFCLASVAGVAHSAEELTNQKRANIERLLEITNSSALAKQMSTQFVSLLIPQLKKVRPDIPDAVFDKLPKVISAVYEENMHTLREAEVALYHKHFTANEIQGLLNFYATDLGRKSIRVMPSLVQESMQAGQRWGRALGPQLDRKLKTALQQEGIEL